MRNDRFENFNRQRDIPQNYPVPCQFGLWYPRGPVPKPAARGAATVRGAASH